MEVQTPQWKSFILALLTLLLLDFFWFTILGRHVYPKDLTRNVHLKYGAVAWITLAAAISALRPSTRITRECTQWGALVGLVTYLVFNGSEAAVRQDWRRWTPIIDTCWGVIVCGTSGAVSSSVYIK